MGVIGPGAVIIMVGITDTDGKGKDCPGYTEGCNKKGKYGTSGEDGKKQGDDLGGTSDE
ncbi:MAG: hypothetical protein ACRC26_01660 [Bacteroidales bacterium]